MTFAHLDEAAVKGFAEGELHVRRATCDVPRADVLRADVLRFANPLDLCVPLRGEAFEIPAQFGFTLGELCGIEDRVDG